MLSHDVVDVLVGMHKMAFYTGYVLLAGTFTFWTLVWPNGRRDRKLRGLALIGVGLLAVTTVTEPAVRIGLLGLSTAAAWDVRWVVAAVLRLVGLLAAGAVLMAVRRHDVVGSRRVVATVSVLVIAGTMVLQSDAVTGPWQVVKVLATTGHVLAVSAWLGGLLALATVLIPREFLDELDLLIPRFSRLATVSIAVLAVTGLLHAVAVAQGVRPLLDSRYGLVLAVKIAIFGLMLVLGNHGRTYAARVSFRARHLSNKQLKASAGVHELAVVMGAELTVAFVALGLTALLVMVAPLP